MSKKVTTNSINEQLKFTINDKLNQLPYIDRELAVRALPRALGITKTTFYRWRMAKTDQRQDILGEKLIMLASFFKCSIIELFTVPPQSLSQSDLKLKSVQALADELNISLSQIK